MTMKTIVLYGSRYGTTEKYAQELGRRLSCPVRPLSGISPDDIQAYDCVVVGGGLYANKAVGAKEVARLAPYLAKKRVAVFTVGITPPTIYDALRVSWRKSYPALVKQDVDFFHFPGSLELDKLNRFHRTTLLILQKFLRKRAGKDLSREEWIMLDALDNASREFRPGNVAPVEELVKTWQKEQGPSQSPDNKP